MLLAGVGNEAGGGVLDRTHFGYIYIQIALISPHILRHWNPVGVPNRATGSTELGNPQLLLSGSCN